MLPLWPGGARVQSLNGELRSHTLHGGVAKKKKVSSLQVVSLVTVFSENFQRSPLPILTCIYTSVFTKLVSQHNAWFFHLHVIKGSDFGEKKIRLFARIRQTAFCDTQESF